jgi:ABC-type antimicrobial peptide transport system permease subunit
MVFVQGFRLAAAGLVIGVAAAAMLTRLMASLLFGVKPGDPMVFLAVSATLCAVAVLAALLPSLRAMRIQPAMALRYE